MGQKKLKRFAEIRSFPNVWEYPQGMAGKWSGILGSGGPLTLELACGKGEYTVGLARRYPERNFLGMDLKGNRIWVGARIALQEGLRNAGFVRSHIDKITQYFAPGEVSEIWLPFPDPQLRSSRARKRLTHPRYLRLYQQILQPGGMIHLKTDSPVLYRFTKTIADMYGLPLEEDIPDLSVSAIPDEDPARAIRTHYEALDIAGSRRIHYLRFRLPAATLPDRDEALKIRIFELEKS